MNHFHDAAYDGDHCKHVAEWHDYRLQEDRRKRNAKLYHGSERRRKVLWN